MNDRPVSKVLQALYETTGHEPKAQGKGWSAHCPAHDDRTRSLSVAEGDDDRVLIHCHRGCTFGAVCDALGIAEFDLFPTNGLLAATIARSSRAAKAPPKTYPTADDAIAALDTFMQRDSGRRAGRWDYTDSEGKVVAVVVRYNLPTPDGEKQKKTFRPVSLHPDGWRIKDPPGLWPLYNLKALADADHAYLVEGEGVVEALRGLGLVATTSAHGGKSPQKTDWEPLAGKTITPIPDNDSTGRGYRDTVIGHLSKLTLIPLIKAIELPDLPPGGDAVDFIEARRAAGLSDDQIRDEIEMLADEADPVKSTVVVVDNDWTQPDPLMAGKQCPKFPIDDAFPPGLAPIRDYVSAVAEALQVPVDLPAMLLLPVGAVALAQKFEIELTPEWREPSAIWTLTLLESGNRKSNTFRKLLCPVHEWEQEEARRLGPLIAKQQEERKIDEKRLDVLRKDAGTSGGSAGQARTEAIELAQKIDEEEILSVPQIATSEPTTEAMGGLLVQNKERIIVASAEADSLDVMLGRYSKKCPNFGIWLVGHSGDHHRVDRRGRAPDHLKRPTLSVGLTVQLEAVRELFSNRQARGRGVIARFLTSAPQSLLGRRKINPKPIPQHLSEHYHLTVHRLLSLPINESPTYIQLSEPASRLFDEFQEQIEPELARGGHLGDCTDWGAKLCGAVARIALVLHGLAELGHSANSARSAPMVSAETMKAALAWAPYLIDQERIVAGKIGSDPAVNTADRVLRWLERTGLDQFSRRDAFTNNRSASVQKVEDIDPALDLLTELGYIRRQDDLDHRGPGQKPSPRFDVNPMWREAVSSD